VRALLLWLLLAGLLGAQNLPAGFTDTLVAGVASPTGLAFTPDGRLLVTTQGGSLRVIRAGVLLGTPALQLASRVCSNSERGLLGVAVDPEFAANQYIYLYHTYRRPSGDCSSRTPSVPVNRVSRFVLPAGNVVDPASERILIDNALSYNGNHNAGDVQFGKDGYLYISVGDGGCDFAGGGCAGQNDAARDRHTLLGKILRLDRDGNPPPTNPFLGPGTARCNLGNAASGTVCQETFAWGLRNPFRMAFDPNAAGVRFFINDVGQGDWEEIDEAAAGADYGWNAREGACANGSTTNCSPANPPPAGMRDPVYAYRHSIAVPGTRSRNCNSISGGAFVPNGVWPPDYDNTYLFADYVCGSIFRLVSFDSAATAVDFAPSLGGDSVVHLAFGPFGGSQALYYTTYRSGGQVRRMVYAGSGPNSPPVAAAAATPTSGSVPLTVTFSAAGSGDPDAGDSLTYFWDFGDGSPGESTAGLTIQHTYRRPGTFTATLRARDQNLAFSSPVTIRVFVGNTAPAPAIQAPAASDTFSVGQNITLAGGATDPEDGALQAWALSWTVILHHGSHTHPFLGPVAGNNIAFAAPAPEDLDATANSFLEIRLTAADSVGETATVTRTFQPLRVNVTFNTVPAGRVVRANGRDLAGPATIVSWAGYSLDVSVLEQTSAAGERYSFQSWSDGAPRNRVIVTPRSPASYTANFHLLSGPAESLTSVSAAHFLRGLALAPNSIASAFGQGLAGATQAATSLPLPATLAGVSVTVRDSAGVERPAPLFFVSPGQVNFLVPESTRTGTATVTVSRAGRAVASGTIQIEAVAPGLFTANSDGRGAPAALAVRTSEGGGQTVTPVFRCDAGPGSCVPAPVDLGAETDDVVLLLFGTGIRGRSSPASINARLGGVPVEVLYAGAQAEFAGLDQINLRLPRSLAGRGEVDLLVEVDGRAANPVRLSIQ